MLTIVALIVLFNYQEKIFLSNNGHYPGDLIAIDPHSIVTTTQRKMFIKKKQPEEPVRKMLQTFLL